MVQHRLIFTIVSSERVYESLRRSYGVIVCLIYKLDRKRRAATRLARRDDLQMYSAARQFLASLRMTFLVIW